MKTFYSFLVLVCCLCSIPSASGALVINSWSITGGNTLSFDISGTIDAGSHIGSQNATVIYIGVPGDTDWVTDGTNVTTPGSSLTQNSGRAVSNNLLFLTNDNASGDHVQLWTADFGNWAIGDSIDLSVTLVDDQPIVAANVNPNDLIVNIGNEPGTFLVAAQSVGGFTAVPEPGSFAFLGLAICVLSFRRRQLNRV